VRTSPSRRDVRRVGPDVLTDSLSETRTAGVAADRLRDAGFDVTAGIGQTGVVGVLRKGEGPTIMLRADMDALPVREETGLAYASTETATDSTGTSVPVMRACGHDMHVAWLIGAAIIMAQTRDTWRGTLMPHTDRRLINAPGELSIWGA
jgi:metal-dependent amidase/aminoacylase/carboxypeptidase family protein